MGKDAWIAVGAIACMLCLSTAAAVRAANQRTRVEAQLGQMMEPGGMMGSGGNASMARRRYYRSHGVPLAYRGLQNPMPATEKFVNQGATLYAEQCAACHGPQGLGNGPSAADLSSPPSNLAQIVHTPFATDEYLFWAISEGGELFHSDMSAFKDLLKPDEIWKIILAMRQGFPEPAKGASQ